MESLKHYGVKGMHWGIRRYQNYDGTRIGAKRIESGGGFDPDFKKKKSLKSTVARSVRKGTNSKPLASKIQEINRKRHEKAAEAGYRDAANLKKHGYEKEAEAVRKVADKNLAKSLTRKEASQEKVVNYVTNKMKSKDYSNSSSEEIMNDWDKYKKEYKNNTNKESLGKKNGVDAYRKKVDYGEEPEGYSAKRQKYEAKLRSDIKKADNIKEKLALKKELKNYSKESKEKAKEYRKWLGQVRDYTGSYKQYELVKNGDKFTNEWINKKTGQVITNKEYYDSFHYDATKRATDFIKLHYS